MVTIEEAIAALQSDYASRTPPIYPLRVNNISGPIPYNGNPDCIRLLQDLHQPVLTLPECQTGVGWMGYEVILVRGHVVADSGPIS